MVAQVEVSNGQLFVSPDEMDSLVVPAKVAAQVLAFAINATVDSTQFFDADHDELVMLAHVEDQVEVRYGNLAFSVSIADFITEAKKLPGVMSLAYALAAFDKI